MGFGLPNALRGLAINVKDYGAKGDGSTDDSAKIQAAINAAASANLPVYFPPPAVSYFIAATLTGTSGVRLIGCGPACTITGSVDPLISITITRKTGSPYTTDTPQPYLEGLRFAPTGASNRGVVITGPGYADSNNEPVGVIKECIFDLVAVTGAASNILLSMTDVSNPMIEKCAFVGLASTGSISDRQATGIQMLGVTTPTIVECFFWQLRYGIKTGNDGTAGQTTQGTALLGCDLEACYFGLHLTGDQAFYASACDLDECYTAVYFDGTTDLAFGLHIADCYLSTCAGAAGLGGRGVQVPVIDIVAARESVKIHDCEIISYVSNEGGGGNGAGVTGATSTTLTCSGASWPTNAYASYVVTVIGSNGQPTSAQVGSNTATVLTLSTAWTNGTPTMPCTEFVLAPLNYGIRLNNCADVDIHDNVFGTDGLPGGFQYGVYFTNNGGTSNVQVHDNNFPPANFRNIAATISVAPVAIFPALTFGVVNGVLQLPLVVRNNHGFNPLGTLFSPGSPAVPASGTLLYNPNPYDAMVYVTGGTGVTIRIGGTASGNGTAVGSSGAVRVPAGGTIELDYTTAPSWTWIFE